jgi:geranylgeranyl diphosphate synthase type II
MDNFNKLKEYLEKRRNQIEETLGALFPKGQPPGERVFSASYYSLSAGGKRLRPILCLMGYELGNKEAEEILPFACGIECIHTYSLIHDDLPCMDNDDLRRGKPACHKAYDEATAILAGDGLQALAYEWFTHPQVVKKVKPRALLKAINLIAKASGLQGMVGGQMADLLSEGKRGNLKLLKWIHEHKTMALIEASLVSGALLAGIPSRTIQFLSRFGKKLGLLFQITDDLLDLIGDETKMGKPSKSDLKKGKLTYPSLFGLEKTKGLAEKTAIEAMKCLEDLEERGELLRALTQYLLQRIS